MKLTAVAHAAQIAQGAAVQAAKPSIPLSVESTRPQTYPTRPPLKTHSSSPIPTSPMLPDVFVEPSPVDQAQLSPWSMPARLGAAPGLERRRSWQSSMQAPSASSSLHRQAVVSRQGPRQENTIASPLSTPSNRFTQDKESRTSGPSFTSRFNPFSGTPSSPAEEQRERIARMAAQVVSSFSPYETPTRASQDSSAFESRGLASSPKTQSFGLGFDFDGSGGLGEMSAADDPKIWSAADHSSGNWGPQGGFPSWQSSKRTSMPVPPRMGAGAASCAAYKTPLILQANSPSMHDSPALGATAQSCWSSSPFPASPWVGSRSPNSFVGTVEEVATGSPLPRSNSLSPLPSRRPSTTSRKSSFCSSPLAGKPLNADALKDESTFDSTTQSSQDLASTLDASDPPSSPSLDMAEVQYLLGYVKRQIDKMSTPKTTDKAAFESINSELAHRASTASEAAPYDWDQYRCHQANFQSSRRASPYLSAAGTWTSSSPSLGGSFAPAGNGFCKSPSLPGLVPPSPLSPGISLPSSVSDSWLSSNPKPNAQIPTSHQASPVSRNSIPTIVGTPATPLRERTSNIRHPHYELPRRSLAGLTAPRTDGGRGSSSSEAEYKSDSPDVPTRRKPTKRGKRSGKRVQQARSERLFREGAEEEEQGENNGFVSRVTLGPSPLSVPVKA